MLYIYRQGEEAGGDVGNSCPVYLLLLSRGSAATTSPPGHNKAILQIQSNIQDNAESWVYVRSVCSLTLKSIRHLYSYTQDRLYYPDPGQKINQDKASKFASSHTRQAERSAI